MSYRVPFIKPNFPSFKELALDYQDILKANWFTNFGPFEQEFAKRIASYIGHGYYAATFVNATSALMASILAVLGRGDNTQHIAMPSFTFVAVADAVIWCGYKPLFIDTEAGEFNMSLSETRQAIASKDYQLAAILFCNPFGVGARNIAKWEAFAEQARKPLIIDSAAGFGSLYKSNRQVGSAGTCEVFSFHATKPFAIGEGGAVVSRNKELIDSLNTIQNFGLAKNREVAKLGFNGKLQEINAAIGLRKFEKFPQILKARQEVLRMYKEHLNPEHFKFQDNADHASLCFCAVTVVGGSSRDKRLLKLKEAGIDAKIYYSPSLHTQPYFKNCKKASSLSNTQKIDTSVLSLPIHDSMRQQDIDLVLATLND